MTRAILALTMAAVTVTACGSTEPEDPRADGGLVIRLAHVPEYAEVQVVNDTAYSSCPVTFKATRRTDLSVSLLSMKVVYYVDSELRQPFDSTMIAGDTVEALWDGPLTVDNQPSAEWTFAAPRPFYMRVRFRYTWGGTSYDMPDLKFRCRPDGPGGSAGPSISGLSVAPVDSVDPTEPLVVRYTVASPAGSWQESIRLTGACDTLVQRSTPLQTTVTREVEIVLPWECHLGGTLQVHVKVTDLQQRSSERDATVQPLVADRYRPTLTSPPLSGEFAVGAEFRPAVTFHENLGLTTIVWRVEPYGATDSVRWGGTGATVTLRILAQSNWVGPVSLKIFARDDQGLVSDTLRSVPDSLRVIPTARHPVVSKQVSGVVRNAVFDEKRNLVYLLISGAADSSVISIRSGVTYDETARVPVQLSAITMDITPSGDSLIVGSGATRSLGVIDLTAQTLSNQVIPVIHPAVPQGNVWQIVAGNNGRVYIGSYLSLMEVSLSNIALRQVGGSNSYSVFRSGNGAVIGVMNYAQLELLHAGDDSYFATRPVPPGTYPRSSFSQDGSRINVGLDILNGLLQPQRSLVAQGQLAPLEDMRLSPDGTVLAYLDQSISGLIRKDVASGMAIDRTPLPSRPIGNFRIKFSADGTRVMIYDISNSARVDFIDLTRVE